ncbi:unnamed protein product [Sympodiomycopsis kandeliae]
MPTLTHPEQSSLVFWQQSNNNAFWKDVPGLTRQASIKWCAEMARLQLILIAFSLATGTRGEGAWKAVLRDALMGDCIVAWGCWYKVLAVTLSTLTLEDRVGKVIDAARKTDWKAEIAKSSWNSAARTFFHQMQAFVVKQSFPSFDLPGEQGWRGDDIDHAS